MPINQSPKHFYSAICRKRIRGPW